MVTVTAALAIPRDRLLIRGAILNNSGAPLPEVLIRLDGTETALASTGADGLYAFLVPAGGSYNLTPGRSGYAFNPPSAILSNLSSNQTSANFVGTPASTLSISGAVVDPSGLPLGDTTIFLSGSTSGACDNMRTWQLFLRRLSPWEAIW